MRVVPVFVVVLIATDAVSAKPSNVILVITDDQGYGDLSCHGNPILRTPNIDRLHSQSVRLTNFHVDPTCSPTRSALMTGRYSTRVGVWHTVMGRNMPRAEELMMPEVFRASGYKTAIFGKWHLGDNYPFRPQDRGFDHTLVHGGGGVGQIPDAWGNDYFDDTYFRNGEPERFEGYCTDVFFRETIRFIESNKDNPFFVYLATNAPHGPYLVPEKYSRDYADKIPDDPTRAKFYGMIANIDENMGRLMSRLDELGLTRDTLLIFMTDNGTARGVRMTGERGNDGKLLGGYNAGMRGYKGSPYDGGHRIPCFLRWPAGNLDNGQDIDRLCAHVDLLPTFIDLCGLAQTRKVMFDGRSLAPILRDAQASWRSRTMFAHHQELPLPEKWRFCSVMTDKWRLVNGSELYEIGKDPGQRKDVSAQHPDVVSDLRSKYESWWRELTPTFAGYSEIVLGHERANPSRLTCFDWHSSRRWWQRNIHAGFVDNGFWAVNVARPGTYRITLRRWPKEVDKTFTATAGKGKELTPTRVRLSIGDIDKTVKVDQDAQQITFTANLERGSARLQSWIYDENGGSRGAYFAEIERMSR